MVNRQTAKKAGELLLVSTLSCAGISYAQTTPNNSQQITQKELINRYNKTIIDNVFKDNVFDDKDLEKVHNVLKNYFEQKNPPEEELNTAKLIEENILANYPGLIGKQDNNKIGLVYQAEQKLTTPESTLIKKVMTESELPQKLIHLKTKDEYTLQDLTLIYFNQKWIINRKNDALNYLHDFYNITSNYFKEKDENARKQFISGGLVYALDSGISDSNMNHKINNLLRKQGIEIEKVTLESSFPKNRFKWFPHWLSIPLGIGIPFARIAFMTKWTGRNADTFDVIDIILNVSSSFAVDMAHPLVYPTRLIAPIVFEPIRKAFKLQIKTSGGQ
ncbi:hypothetical protein HY643_01745 [Candidatus Woesearchaeota archaeon]|nr:hypothetical protein [Candidatus Woesearchaeota archaeon]